MQSAPADKLKVPETSVAPTSLPVEGSPAITKPEESGTPLSEQAPNGLALWQLRRREQQVIAALCFVLLGWCLVRGIELSRWGQAEIEIQRQSERQYAYGVDPNTATWIELALLEGIGEVLGKKIVADREANGPYQTVEDLLRVNGVGRKTLEKFQNQLQISSETAQEKTP